MSTTNLLRIGKFIQRPKYVEPIYKIQRENVLRSKMIKKAIHMECPPDLANSAIHGFRRSAGGDAMAEEDFLRTNVPQHHVKRDFHYRRALRVCEKLFRPSRRLNPIAFPDLRFYPWSLPVSAEAPFTVQRKWSDKIRQRQADGEDIDGKITFHNLYNEIFNLNRHLVHQIKEKGPGFWNQDGTPKPYWFTTLHARSHLVKQDKEDKLRAVFGVPKLLLQVENMFIWNLQKEYLNQKVKSPMLWGFETFKGGWNKLYRRFGITKETYLSADWSGFDRFALFEVIDDVHLMWRDWFDFDRYEPTDATHAPEGIRLSYPESKANPVKIQNLWDWMTHSVKFTPIRGFSGQLYQWQFNGIASGYQQTQLLDSFVNAIYLLTCLSACGINIESDDFDLLVQGDDSLSGFHELVGDYKVFLKRMETEAKTRFNAILSPDKTSIGNSLSDVEVLSYRNRHGISYRDEAELLAHLLYPERNQDLHATASSCIGIALASMGCSKNVYNTCKNVYEFLTNQFGIEPDWEYLQKYLGVRGLPEDELTLTKRFPTWDEVFCQNFDLTERTYRMKQHLWPTDPTGGYGFHFLNS
nr:RNA-dependent RNA polymerase [Sarcosphaera coronaria partitivirus]